MRKSVVAVSIILAIFASCAEGTATLDFTAAAPTLTGTVTSTRLTLIATNGDGTVGTGTVTLTATNGAMLDSSSVTIDKFGTAVVGLSCETASALCAMSSVLVEGTWTVKGKPVTGAITVNLRPSNAGTGGGTGTGGGAGGGGVDFADAGCPVFIMNGMPGVIPGPLNFNSTNARFRLYNDFTISPPDFRVFSGGRGAMIELTLPPAYVEGQGWNVFLFHTLPGMQGMFQLGLYTPASDGDGTGTRISGVGTMCTSFAGDRFDVREVTFAGGGISHIAAELWAHCPSFGGNPPGNAHGYICF